jgi:sugar lactone lactonase YvrE
MYNRSRFEPARCARAVMGAVALAVLAGGAGGGAVQATAAESAAEKAMAKAREKDPAWKTSHEEVAVIQVGKKGKGGLLSNFCLDREGNVLACCALERGRTSKAPPAKEAGEIQVFSPEGKLLQQWKLETQPQAICVDRQGTIYAGGGGRLYKLDAAGRVVASADAPVLAEKFKVDAALLKSLKQDRKMTDEDIAAYTKSLARRSAEFTGMAVTERDLFVVCPSPSDYGYMIYRMDHDFKNAKLIVKGLRGCCGQMDLQASGDKLWIPHNARHRVECRDRDGKELTQFGKEDSKAADGFGGCCEPKNLRVGANGDIFSAESGPPVVIKRFSAAGKFLGVVGLPKFKTSCVRVTVEVSPDGKRFYILNTGDDAIHVLAPKA